MVTKKMTLLDTVRKESESLLLRVLKSGKVEDEEFSATDASGRTCLSYAAALGSHAMIDMLHATCRIDPNQADSEGNSPLIYAVSLGHYLTTMKLLSWDDIDINHQNGSGFTALMKAAIHGQLPCIELLLSAGAEIELTDSVRQMTAFQWAKFCGGHDCAKALKKCSEKKSSPKRNSISRKMSHSFTVNENNNLRLTNRRSSIQRIKSLLSIQPAIQPIKPIDINDYKILGVNGVVMCTSTPALPVLLSNSERSEALTEQTANGELSQLDSQRIFKQLNLSPLSNRRCTPKIKITNANGETVTPSSRSFREVRKRNNLIINKKVVE